MFFLLTVPSDILNHFFWYLIFLPGQRLFLPFTLSSKKKKKHLFVYISFIRSVVFSALAFTPDSRVVESDEGALCFDLNLLLRASEGGHGAIELTWLRSFSLQTCAATAAGWPAWSGSAWPTSPSNLIGV